MKGVSGNLPCVESPVAWRMDWRLPGSLELSITRRGDAIYARLQRATPSSDGGDTRQATSDLLLRPFRTLLCERDSQCTRNYLAA